MSACNINIDSFLRSLKGIEPFWKHRNIMVLVRDPMKNHNHEESMGVSTVADTRDGF